LRLALRQLCVFALLATSVAWAQPVEVVAGEDLTAWREIQRERPQGERAVEVYRWYLRTYPTSALAEVAWARLVELGAAEGAWAEDPELRPHLDRVQRSWERHQVELGRSPAAVVVAELRSDGSSMVSQGPRWTTALHAGGGWDGQDTFGAFGLRGMRGPVGFCGRVGADGAWFVEADARVEAPLRWAPHLEVGLDTLGRVGARLGGRLVLDDDLWLEAAGGVTTGQHGLAPVARVELVHPVR